MSSASLRLIRDTINSSLIFRCYQHARNRFQEQPNLFNFAERIDGYAEASDEDSTLVPINKAGIPVNENNKNICNIMRKGAAFQ